jgi:hypothetical protein
VVEEHDRFGISRRQVERVRRLEVELGKPGAILRDQRRVAEACERGLRVGRAVVIPVGVGEHRAEQVDRFGAKRRRRIRGRVETVDELDEARDRGRRAIEEEERPGRSLQRDEVVGIRHSDVRIREERALEAVVVAGGGRLVPDAEPVRRVGPFVLRARCARRERERRHQHERAKSRHLSREYAPHLVGVSPLLRFTRVPPLHAREALLTYDRARGARNRVGTRAADGPAAVHRLLLLLACCSLLPCLAGCWDSHVRPEPPIPVPGGCDRATEPTCTTRASPCDALALVAAVCEDEAWSCPPGARLYAQPWSDDVCLPLEGRVSTGLFSDGVHEAPVPIALGDHCAWVFPVETGGAIRLAAIDTAPTCAALSAAGSDTPIDDLDGDLDFVAVGASFEDTSGATRVLVRGWRFDPLAGFGVRSLGVGLARVDGGRIAVSDAWLFGDDLDLGDAAIVVDGFAYAYGCPGDPHALEEDCIVGRAPLGDVDTASAWDVLGDRGWGEGAPVRVFGSGPHRSAVVEDPRGSGFLHVYAIGFGTDLMITTASAPEGPWSPARVLVPCDLPPDDPGAYCAGPTVHRELLDPLAPSTLVVSYSVGTTAEDGPSRRAADPAAYWPHVVRVSL